MDSAATRSKGILFDNSSQRTEIAVSVREPMFEAPECEDWTEEDWERFLRQADARTAKFQELFETLIDHPSRDAIIAHEMGWEGFFGECRSKVDNCDRCGERFECEAYEMLRLMEGPDNVEDDPEAEELLECFEQVKEIAAYRVSCEFALRLEECFRRLFPDDDEDEAIQGALLSASMAPAQIAGGHGIGYDRNALCGNIANCKRALANAEVCLAHLKDLERRGMLPKERSARLLAENISVQRAVVGWIEDLRSRVWWQ